MIFGEDQVAPVLAAFKWLDSKIWVNVKTHILNPRNSNTIRSLSFIPEANEGFLHEVMIPLDIPEFLGTIYTYTYKSLKCQTL